LLQLLLPGDPLLDHPAGAALLGLLAQHLDPQHPLQAHHHPQHEQRERQRDHRDQGLQRPRPPATSMAAAITAIAMPQANLRDSPGSPGSSLDIEPSTSTAESAEVTKKIASSTM